MRIVTASFVFALAQFTWAQESVFSGPQVGEAVKPFRAFAVTGPQAGKEIQALESAGSKPQAVVFVHSLERSLLPLLRVIDNYGAARKDLIETTVVFLSDDRAAMENRLPLVAQSLRLSSPMLLSLDGIEGPGAYGLNRKCLLTVIGAKDGKATTNFALLQPGIADAPKVVEALAKTCGDANPPTLDQLQPQAPAGAMRGAAGPRGTAAPALDLSRIDTSTPEAMKRAIEALIAEVRRLRAENEQLRSGGNRTAPARPVAGNAANLPGETPTDAQLVALLRQFIQPSNSEEQVDRALKGMEERMKGNADLTRQAVGGLVRVIHLKYGTEYARKAGQAFVEKHKK